MNRPAVGPPRPWTFPRVDATALPNGLAVRACHLPGRGVASARLVLPGGAATEPAGSYGVALLWAATLLRGGLAAAVEEVGGSVNAEVTWDALTVTLDAPVASFGRALALVAAAVAGPFGIAGVANARADRLHAIARDRADHGSRAAEVLAAALFGSRYGLPQAGRAEDVALLDPAAVTAFHGRVAAPAGATLVLAADPGLVDLPATAADAFGGWAGHAGSPVPAAPGDLSAAPRAVLVEVPGAVQSAVTFGCVTPPRTDPCFAALSLAADCLSGTVGSRLYRRLREREALTYSASGAVEGWRRAGRYVASFACAADATARAVLAALDEVRCLHAGAITGEELDRVRGQRAGLIPLHLDTPSALAAAVAENVATGLPDDAHALLRTAVQDCPYAAVDRAARTYLDPARMTIAVVGATRAVAGELAAAGFAVESGEE
jgi:predicted Zn-dependent peptidase